MWVTPVWKTVKLLWPGVSCHKNQLFGLDTFSNLSVFCNPSDILQTWYEMIWILSTDSRFWTSDDASARLRFYATTNGQYCGNWHNGLPGHQVLAVKSCPDGMWRFNMVQRCCRKVNWQCADSSSMNNFTWDWRYNLSGYVSHYPLVADRQHIWFQYRHIDRHQ